MRVKQSILVISGIALLLMTSAAVRADEYDKIPEPVKNAPSILEGGYVQYTGAQVPYVPVMAPEKQPVYTGLGPDGQRLPTQFPPLPKMIAGKPYSVTPGDVAGTFNVKWGDESMVWKPQPWMQAEQIKMGPAYNAQWLAPGLPSPWELPIEQRDKLSGADYWERGWDQNWYNTQIDVGQDLWTGLIYLPNGELRTATKNLEAFAHFSGMRGQKYLPASDRDRIKRFYAWAITAPDELRNQAGVTTFFYEPKMIPEDLLYLPQVRRTRRLAGGVAKQYFPGTIVRYEDVEFVQPLPELDYKLIGFKLFNPPEELIGFGPHYFEKAKGVSDAGDVVAIVEITPKPGVDWWYAKRLVYVGLIQMSANVLEAFDKNGKQINVLTRSVVDGNNDEDHLYTPDGPKPPSWYTIWGRYFSMDMVGGFTFDAWSDVITYNSKSLPADFFTPETLAKQPSSFAEWISGE